MEATPQTARYSVAKLTWPKGHSITANFLAPIDRGHDFDSSYVGVTLESTSMASSHAAMQQGWLFMGQYEPRVNRMVGRPPAPETDPCLKLRMPHRHGLGVRGAQNGLAQRVMTPHFASPTSELWPGITCPRLWPSSEVHC